MKWHQLTYNINTKNINFENQELPILKMRPPDTTSLQKSYKF